jgi:Arc/MetJ family transcription regulator
MQKVVHTIVCVAREVKMATNLDLDDKLVEQARLLGNHKSKKAAVTEALEEYIQHRKQIEIIKDFGTVEYDETYNYKKLRKTK